MTVRCSEGNSDNGGIYPRRASTPVAACRGAEFEDIFQFVGETQTQIGFGWRLIPLPQSVQSCVALHRSFFDSSKVPLSKQAATIFPHNFLYFLFKSLHTTL